MQIVDLRSLAARAADRVMGRDSHGSQPNTNPPRGEIRAAGFDLVIGNPPYDGFAFDHTLSRVEESRRLK